MDEPMRDKKCPRCKAWRFKTQYIKDSREMKTCEVCRDNNKKYTEDNRDKISERKKQYRIDNRDKISENHKQIYIKNRDKILERTIKYNEEQKQNNPLQCKFKQMIRNSKHQDKRNNLTIDEDYINIDFLNELWVKQTGLCFYQDCDCILEYEIFDKHNRNPNQITIQRHNNDICHSKSNTCIACFNCNVNKRKELFHFTQLLEATEQMTLE